MDCRQTAGTHTSAAPHLIWPHSVLISSGPSTAAPHPALLPLQAVTGWLTDDNEILFGMHQNMGEAVDWVTRASRECLTLLGCMLCRGLHCSGAVVQWLLGCLVSLSIPFLDPLQRQVVLHLTCLAAR